MLCLFFVVLLGLLGKLTAEVCQEYDTVNSFIGTGGLAYGYGGINPGAQLPYSALRLGPDTTDTVVDMSFRHFSGYNYNDKIIRGFSHTHLVGGGVNDLGNFGFMPTVTDAAVDLKSLPIDSAPFWWSSFNKTSERASPGFYYVELNNPRVEVDLMAIGRFAGVHTYTWKRHKNEDTIPSVVVDICHAAKLKTGDDNSCLNASITIDPAANTFSGTLLFKGGLSHQIWMYVSGEIAVKAPSGAAVKDWQTCTDSDVQAGTSTCSSATAATSTSGTLFSIVRFDTAPATAEDRTTSTSTGDLSRRLEVEVKVGISFISEALAAQNLQDALQETSDSKKLAARTKSIWCNLLHEMHVEVLPGMYTQNKDTENTEIAEKNGNADVDDLEVVMNSAHYRSMMSPTSYTESGGLYLGMDKVVHNATAERFAAYGSADGTFYSDFSLWDTVRTQHPWQLLRNEHTALDFARSLTEMTVQQNAFPRWPLASTESSCMIGESGAAVIVECILAGMGKLIDVAAIQPIFLQQSTEPVPLNGRTDVENYISAGFVSQDVSGDATSETLSYAFDDYLLAKISEYTGDHQSAQEAMLRSKNYAVVWSPESALFCPKYTNGTMKCPESGKAPWSWQVYREGDAYHWSWFVPHDPEGLIALYPTVDAYTAALESFFANHVANYDKFGNALPNPYYWAGNEHDFLAPWMFNFAGTGACTRTQYWVRRLIQMHFSNSAHGVPGNEDYGSMATWVLFASLGIYPQAGTSRFLLGSPHVLNAKIQLHHVNGFAPTSFLEVVSYNNTVENTFVQKLLVNGQEHAQPWIDRAVLAAPGGCKLEFFMASEEVSGLCM